MKFAIGDLVQLTGSGWNDISHATHNEIVLIVGMYSGDDGEILATFIDNDGDKETIFNAALKNNLDFTATIIQKAVK